MTMFDLVLGTHNAKKLVELRLLLPEGDHDVILENRTARRRKKTSVEVRASATTRISHW